MCALVSQEASKSHKKSPFFNFSPKMVKMSSKFKLLRLHFPDNTRNKTDMIQ